MELKVLTPVKAIRAKCMDCTCQQIVEVRNCRITTCALWAYRMGKRPKKGRMVRNSRLTVEQLTDLNDRIKRSKP